MIWLKNEDLHIKHVVYLVCKGMIAKLLDIGISFDMYYKIRSYRQRFGIDTISKKTV